jgi:radical SAM superfamily enzyme YgiQ (UPF0313 family)
MKKPDLHAINGDWMPPDTSFEKKSICLVSALTVADFIDPDLITEAHANTGAQLGILTLAAILREQGFQPHVVNLDDLFYDFIERDQVKPGSNSKSPSGVATSKTARSDHDPAEFFFPFVVRHLQSLSFDVFGFSSICSSYPLTLRLAQETRRLNPETKVILGGPQASVVDVATLQSFRCVDVIVRGEADQTFPALLPLLVSGDAGWEAIPGITFRRGDEVIRNPNAPVIEDLDSLPLPAFDLDSRIRDRGGIHLEIGRGCPFACTFCSTNDFFRRNFRLKSPAKMIAEISAVKKDYGLKYFSLVHDMYTIDRKKVVEFCEAILASGENFTWGCSARTDCIDDELLGLMAGAGCTGIFFGIETGSQRLQQVIKKKLDLGEAWQRIQCANRHGIQTTVALIVGFPEETRDDLRDTIHFFINSLRFDHAEPQCSLLAPLAATPIYEQHKDQLVFDHIFSDMSHQSWRQDPVEAEMIKAYPDIFPNFYAIPTIELDRRFVKEVVDFITYLATWFRWLPVALLEDSGDLLRVFEHWREWLAARQRSDADEDIGWTPYYSHRRFQTEFLEFVRTWYLPNRAKAPAAIAALLLTEGATPNHGRRQAACDTECLDEDCIPYRPDTLFMVDVEVDYKELIESLRNKTDLNQVSLQESTIVFSAAGETEVDVWQLPPLSAALLRLCNGTRTVREIAREFSLLGIELSDIPPEAICLFGMQQLRADGYIGVSSSAVIWEEACETKRARPPRFSVPPQANNTQQPWPPLSATNVSSNTE